VVAMFTRAREAVAVALDGQRGVLAEEWPIGAELRVRMALHTGAARLRDEGDDFAAAVMRCARLRAVAHGGQMLLSGATAELVADQLPDAPISSISGRIAVAISAALNESSRSAIPTRGRCAATSPAR
jgi:class 3 adenylate cyclase